MNPGDELYIDQVGRAAHNLCREIESTGEDPIARAFINAAVNRAKQRLISELASNVAISKVASAPAASSRISGFDSARIFHGDSLHCPD